MEILPRTNPIGMAINKHLSFAQMESNPPVVLKPNSILEGIESRHTDNITPSPKFSEEFLPIVEKRQKAHT